MTGPAVDADIDGSAVVAEIRARRRRHRRESVTTAERVMDIYAMVVAALVFLPGIASMLEGEPSTALHRFVADRGAGAAGVLVAMVVTTGLRSGSFGGPLLFTPPDVTLLLMSPAPQRAILRTRIARTATTTIGVGTGLGALAVGLAGTRLGGAPGGYILAGVLAGATAGALWCGAALVANRLRLPSGVSFAIGAALVAWSVADAATRHITSPLSAVGSLAVFPAHEHFMASALGVVLGAAVLAIGAILLEDVDAETALTRSAAASALAAGIALQDLRAFFLVAHSRPDERPRQRPWARPPGPGTWAAWRRSWQGLLRFPVARLLRLAALGVAIGALVVAAWTVPLLALFAVAAIYVAAFEACEPIAQEVDRPTRRATHPLRSPQLYMRMLAPSFVLLAAVFAIGVAAAVLLGAPAPAEMLAVAAIPAAFAGVAAATYALARGKPSLETNLRFVLDPTGFAIYQFHFGPAVAAGSGAIVCAIAGAIVHRGATLAAVLPMGAIPALLGAAAVGLTFWVTRGEQ